MVFLKEMNVRQKPWLFLGIYISLVILFIIIGRMFPVYWGNILLPSLFLGPFSIALSGHKGEDFNWYLTTSFIQSLPIIVSLITGRISKWHIIAFVILWVLIGLLNALLIGSGYA